MIIAVDFDNCLVEYADTPFGKFTLKPNAREVIEKYHAQGVEFVLNTARYGRYLIPAIRFIRKEKLPVRIKITLSKINADLYIDDHNIFCEEIDWERIDSELRRILDVQSTQKNGDKCISQSNA